ncbi:uncharacterized protein LOC110436774 isoform X1 [Sorghum bicolor]|uniref:uncharacterized protein LOC110436774 isoform X1 n=1 Tax=Sorghum bicolor TaxID=4558 RepID=UPI000B42511B|nr:uncharacterized protein LOC110436774 isoform X1 [Sorghum bicolor]|eukprot:XP_021319932.1 uncharacterized protein LOC110436774 isoform X1 [Sorghum bicolor]
MRTASIALAMTTPAPPGWCPNHDVSRTGSGGSIYTTSNDNLHITVDSSSPSPDLAAPVPRRHVRILDDAVVDFYFMIDSDVYYRNRQSRRGAKSIYARVIKEHKKGMAMMVI